MKHCHFSILCDEIAFLKQKVPFLYSNFDQLIFYDLNITTKQFSTDGSHEYLKNYSDPEKKITIVEEKDLSKAIGFWGSGCEEKRRMFAIGSKYVKDDMDVFWCTDLDEFFNKSLIYKVEQLLENPDIFNINIPHLLFFKDNRYIYKHKDFGDFAELPWPRIRRHKLGNIYPHCEVVDKCPFIRDETIFHFSVVGRNRLLRKMTHRYGLSFMKTFDELNNMDLNIKPGELKYLGQVHGEVLNYGLALNTHKIPEYINIPEMLNDLGVKYVNS